MIFNNKVIQQSVESDTIFKLLRRISICYQAPTPGDTYYELVDYMLDQYNFYNEVFDSYKSKIMSLQDTLEKARLDYCEYRGLEKRIM